MVDLAEMSFRMKRAEDEAIEAMCQRAMKTGGVALRLEHHQQHDGLDRCEVWNGQTRIGTVQWVRDGMRFRLVVTEDDNG